MDRRRVLGALSALSLAAFALLALPFTPPPVGAPPRAPSAFDHPACAVPYIGQIATDLAPFPTLPDASLDRLPARLFSPDYTARLTLNGTAIFLSTSASPNPLAKERAYGIVALLAAALEWHAAEVDPRGLRADLPFLLRDVSRLDPGSETRYWLPGWTVPGSAPRPPHLMYGPVSGTGGAHFPYPDFFLNFDGVRGSMRRAGSEKPLGAKQPTLFFRGSSTGYMCCPAGSDWRTFPRMRFAEMCSRPEAAGKCDGGIVKYVQMSNSTVAEANATLGTKPALPLEDWVRRYRYVASIDGNGWASRFGALLAAGVAVFKQSSPFSEFFYSALKPWVHYVPMKADVSDALEKVAWADAHPEKVAAIAREGRDFVARHLRDENVRCYVAALVEEWGRRQGMVEVPEGAKLVHTLQVEPESKGEG